MAVYSSAIVYHTNTPVLEETVRVTVPPVELESCHVLFLLYHQSSDARKGASLFSFAFLPLTGDDGIMRPDGQARLQCYTPSGDVFPHLGHGHGGKGAGGAGGAPPLPWHQGGVLPLYLVTPGSLSRRRDELRVTIRLCSTRKTQNVRGWGEGAGAVAAALTLGFFPAPRSARYTPCCRRAASARRTSGRRWEARLRCRTRS